MSEIRGRRPHAPVWPRVRCPDYATAPSRRRAGDLNRHPVAQRADDGVDRRAPCRGLEARVEQHGFEKIQLGSAGEASRQLSIAGQVVGNPDELYLTAVDQFNRGSTTTARLAFERFLAAYPSHARAPDAHYYLADILVQEDQLEDALAAFQEIQELFPTAARVPYALYRIALIQIALGDDDDAEETLQRIVNTYPGTGVALQAQDKLDEIR